MAEAQTVQTSTEDLSSLQSVPNNSFREESFISNIFLKWGKSER